MGDEASGLIDSSGQFSQTAGGNNQAQAAPINSAQRVVPAGTILYAVLNTGVNSDSTQYVRATIVEEGPYKGANLLGQVRLRGDKVILEFDRMGHRGRDYPLSAIAVDPETQQSALADSVDRHILQRYGMLWGAAFLEGYADALSNTTTVINTDGSQVNVRERLPSSTDQALVAAGRVGERTAPIMAQQFGRAPTVHVDAGRPVGIMLLQGLPN